MSEGQLRLPWHLWAVGVVGVLWNLMGVFDFMATITKFEPYMSQFPEAFLAYFYSMPVWRYVLWGIAVWGGLVGCILLLMRRSLAVPIFGVSLLGVVVTFAAGFMDTNVPEGASNIAFSAAIMAIAAGLLGYAVYLSRRGFLA